MNKNKSKAPAGVQPGMITRAQIIFQPNTVREADSSVEFVLTTEYPATIFDWERFDYVQEVLRADGLVVPENNQVPLLDSHDRSSTQNILGSVREIRQEAGKVVGRLFFSSVKEAQEAFTKIKEGHLDSGSVGYSQNQSAWIKKDESFDYNGQRYEGPLLLTTKWSLKEYSLVAVGADPNAKARTENPEKGNTSVKNAANKLQEATAMSFKQFCRSIGVDVATLTETQRTSLQVLFDLSCRNLAEDGQISADIKAAAESIVKATAPNPEEKNAETARAAKITELCTRHGCSEMAAEFIRTSANIESVQDKILVALAERSTPVINANNPAIVSGESASEKFERAAVDGMLMRAGLTVKNAAPGAENFRGLSFEGIAREALRLRGIDTSMMGRTEILTRAQSTSDFPKVLANVANKAMMIGYQAAPSTWRAWARKGILPDFKTATRPRLSDAPDMELVLEGGEIKQGVMKESGETIALTTLAKKLVITRQALINDDMGVFDTLFRAFGFRAANLIEATAYGVLTGNAAMSDTGLLFNTTAVTTAGGHANMASSGAVVSSTTVDAGQIAIGAQVGENGSVLSLMPQFLVGGFANKMAIEILCNSTADTTLTSNANYNPFNSLTPIISGHVSAKKWYLIANPNMIDTVEVAFLDGNEAPTLYRKDNEGDILGSSFVGYIDLAAKALDFRGMYYNAGQ